MHQFSRRLFLGGMGAALLAAPARATTGHEFYCGLNCSGLEDNPPNAPTRAMLATYAAQGVRHIRLPGLWEHFQDRPMGPLNDAAVAQYRNVVTTAHALGISVLCEPCHNYGGRMIFGTAQKFGGGILTAQMFADFWMKFVTAMHDTPGVAGWDLMNEPSDLEGDSLRAKAAAWVDAAQNAIHAIRNAGNHLPVHVEGYGHSSAQAWAVNNPDLHTLHDPLDRLVFSAHCYLDRDNSGQHYFWDEEVAAGDQVSNGRMSDNTGVERLQPFIRWLRQYGRQGNIGECGAGQRDTPDRAGDAGWLAVLGKTIACCKAEKLPFYYWGTGPDLGVGYPYGLEPRDGVMPPQWTVLKHYL